MIRVRIGDDERELPSVSENWIHQQINRRMLDGKTICIRVLIRQGQLQMNLSTLSCPGGNGGRPPNRDELNIFDLWERCGMADEAFQAGDLVNFLNRLRRCA